MKLETVVLFLGVCIVIVALVAYGFDANDCSAKHGVMVKTVWGSYECVERK